MASKIFYPVIAVAGIAIASGAAWWWQQRPAASASATTASAGSVAGASGPAAGASAPAPGIVSVEAARVRVSRLADDAQTVGSLKSRRSVMVRPEVSGRVTQLNFRDGDRVRKGQLLVQFDDQLQQAQVQQAQAELSIATANDKRNRELVAQNFISQRSVDESGANLQVAQAKLALQKATAERLKIIAPFDGIAGIRNVNVGDYLKDGTDIVNIEDLDAVFVDFRLPERFQSKVRRGQRAILELDALPGRKFTATVQAIDPLLDANGRSVGVRGCVDNRQLQLRPGMFARVTSVFGERENAKVVPEEALVPQGGRQFVIKLVDGKTPETRATQRVEVKVGMRRPGLVEIAEGLEAGDQIVTAGQQRLQRDGTSVRVVEVRPAAGAGSQGGQGGPGGPRGAGGGSGGPGAAGPATSAGPVPAAGPAAAPMPMAGVKVVARPVSGPNPCAGGDAPQAGDAAPGEARPRRATPTPSAAPLTPQTPPQAPARNPA